VAVARALAVYRGRIVPQVQGELAGWRERAAAIPDTGPRAQALAAIAEKGLNVEATAVFATLAPRRRRATATRAMVALQVAIDYLDSLGERPSADPLREGLRQHAALTGVGDPEGPFLTGDPDDPHLVHDPYLAQLVAAYRASLVALPSHTDVGGALARAITRCGEGQAHTHAAEHGDRAALAAWAEGLGADPAYRWWEAGAGASSSVAAHALIAAAADPRTTAAEAELVDTAYFPSVGALTVLLDDLIDRDEDGAAGAHNYIAYYDGSGDTADRLALIVHRARAGLARLRHAHRHAGILTGVVGFYLSAPAAETPFARPVRERLLAAAGPAVRPIVAVMRRRRSS
jgi:tetraprenyl-beta-curcumene synthase